MSSKDPREILAQAPMGTFQIIAVGMCVLLNALDGFDVLSISFAAPGIANEWGVDRAALGIVLSMELIGMAIGSVVIGNIADIIGRRPTILTCLVVMAVGIYVLVMRRRGLSWHDIGFRPAERAWLIEATRPISG